METIRRAWFIKEECWQRDDYCGGYERVSDRWVYGPFDTEEDARKQAKISNANYEKTRFGYKYVPMERTLYEYTQQRWYP